MSLKKRSRAFEFLKQALAQSLELIKRGFLWKDYGKSTKLHGFDDKDDELIELIRLVPTDYTVNCIKPNHPTKTNERTPFVESIVPLFKYQSSIYPVIHLVCEVRAKKGTSVWIIKTCFVGVKKGL